jgi:MSHA biogenesis protein MshL
VVQPGTILRTQPGEALTGIPTGAVQANNRTDEIFSGAGTIIPGAGGLIAASALGKGFFGLAFQSANFAALLNFLESQGSVSVLSSPRIATLNNQKAVLKVGTDELFVTNVTSSTTTTTTGSVSAPSVTLQPYFSGISLDVTPQIDEDGNIILHVHPAVSTVTEKEKVIDLGALGIYRLPLAASSINETDSIVRVQDGNIVAIGGLMRQEQSSDRSQLPGATGAVANALGQRSSALRKRELVILIKPTVIDNDRAWTQDIKDVQERVRTYPTARPAE